MAALELGVGIPVAIEQARENLRFDFALLQLVVALLIARVIFAIRIYRRHEHNILPVGRPDRSVGAGRNIRHLMRLTDEGARARIKIARPNLRRIGRFRRPNQFLSIG